MRSRGLQAVKSSSGTMTLGQEQWMDCSAMTMKKIMILISCFLDFEDCRQRLKQILVHVRQIKPRPQMRQQQPHHVRQPRPRLRHQLRRARLHRLDKPESINLKAPALHRSLQLVLLVLLERLSLGEQVYQEGRSQQSQQLLPSEEAPQQSVLCSRVRP
jgi:hypothetical protein